MSTMPLSVIITWKRHYCTTKLRHDTLHLSILVLTLESSRTNMYVLGIYIERRCEVIGMPQFGPRFGGSAEPVHKSGPAFGQGAKSKNRCRTSNFFVNIGLDFYLFIFLSITLVYCNYFLLLFTIVIFVRLCDQNIMMCCAVTITCVTSEYWVLTRTLSESLYLRTVRLSGWLSRDIRFSTDDETETWLKNPP